MPDQAQLRGVRAIAAVLLVSGFPTAAFAVGSVGEAKPSYVDVAVSEAHGLWSGGIFALDVRTVGEFDAGHIPGAYNISSGELNGRLGEIAHLKSDPVLVYCWSGGRSAVASQLLAGAGFSGIRNMLGGFSAWQGAGYEVAVGNGNEGEEPGHSADQDGNHVISIEELLRVVQFYNSGGYHCEASGEDGYAPGAGAATACTHHASDYHPQDWAVNLTELLRLIQFYNSGGYYNCPDAGSEDGYCPGAP